MIGDDVPSIAILAEKTVFRQRSDSSQAVGACLMRLGQLAFGGRQANDFEAVPSIFQAFILFVGQYFDWQCACGGAALLKLRGHVADPVAAVFLGIVV